MRGRIRFAVALLAVAPTMAHAEPGVVDTHDHYAHTNVVDRSRFRWFHRVDGKPAVALTIDCARVDVANATEILDALRTHDVKVTFFVSGLFLFTSPARGVAGGIDPKILPLVQRMIEDGHEFGSHTQTHPHNDATIDWTRENEELRRGWEAALAQIHPGPTFPPNARLKSYWRAPFGEYDARALALAARAGFPRHFGWNVDVRDAMGAPDCRDRPTERCLSPAKLTDFVLAFGDKNGWSLDGFVILSHLENRYRWASRPDGLERLVTTVKGKGHVFARLSEMFVDAE